jgi:hypothetical protein
MASMTNHTAAIPAVTNIWLGPLSDVVIDSFTFSLILIQQRLPRQVQRQPHSPLPGGDGTVTRIDIVSV